jgi:hypothetical protein
MTIINEAFRFFCHFNTQSLYRFCHDTILYRAALRFLPYEITFLLYIRKVVRLLNASTMNYESQKKWIPGVRLYHTNYSVHIMYCKNPPRFIPISHVPGNARRDSRSSSSPVHNARKANLRSNSTILRSIATIKTFFSRFMGQGTSYQCENVTCAGWIEFN